MVFHQGCRQCRRTGLPGCCLPSGPSAHDLPPARGAAKKTPGASDVPSHDGQAKRVRGTIPLDKTLVRGPWAGLE
jgi:hypothetical protein